MICSGRGRYDVYTKWYLVSSIELVCAAISASFSAVVIPARLLLQIVVLSRSNVLVLKVPVPWYSIKRSVPK